jgi:hypothetical protein
MKISRVCGRFSTPTPRLSREGTAPHLDGSDGSSESSGQLSHFGVVFPQ